ncbi:MAG: TIM barrel protein [Candidatus Woesearchaeota archaeon]
MDKLRFGTAGIPVSTKGNTIQGIKDVRKLGLDSFELEFVRSINIKKDKALEIKKVAKENNIVLTCHAPYFINLNSEEKKKYYASVGYVKNSAMITSLCGGWSVCFHAGYYMKQEPEKVFKKIKEGVKLIVKEVKQFDKNIWIRPEISGKPSQFGDLKELIKLSKEIDQVMPCIDFSHLYSRSLGKYNTKEEFKQVLIDLEKGLGKTALNNMHIHISGIAYGEKGEKNHLVLKESKFNYKDLLKTLKDFKCKGVVTCESPNIEEDALLMQKTYKKI